MTVYQPVCGCKTKYLAKHKHKLKQLKVFSHIFFSMSLSTVCLTSRHTALYKTTPPSLPHLLNCTDMSTEHRLNLSSISAL